VRYPRKRCLAASSSARLRLRGFTRA